MSRDIMKEFLVSLGFAVDQNSARRAIEAQKKVEAEIRKSDERMTGSSLRELAKREAGEARARGERLKGMAEIKAEMDKAASQEKQTLAQQIRGLAQRRLEEAKTTTQKLAAVKEIARIERESARAVEREQAKAQAATDRHARHVQDRVRNVASFVSRATLAAEGMAVGFIAATERFAARLEKMAYSSERTGSSVGSLRSYSYAASQGGGTAAGALNSVESFARKLRENPQGMAAFLRTLGVNALDGKGQMRGAAELAREARKGADSMPYARQLLYMDDLGFDEDTWRAMDPAKSAAREAEYREKLRRTRHDPDAAKGDAEKLEQSWRSMWESITIVGEKATSKIFKDVGSNLKSLTDFIDQHGDQIADIISKIAQAVLAIARALLELATSDKVKGLLDGFLKQFGSVDEKTGEWTANIDKLKLALEGLAAFVAGAFVKKFLGGFDAISEGGKGFWKLLAFLSRKLGIPLAIYEATKGHDFQTPDEYARSLETDADAKRFDDERRAQGGSLKRWFGDKWGAIKGGVRRFLGGGTAAAGERQGAVSSPANLNGGARESYDFWRSKGLSHEQAAGLVGMEQGESQFNPRARGDGGQAHGAFQHHADRRAAILAATGIDMSNSTHQQQLEGAWWELNNTHKRALRAIKAAITPSGAAAAGVELFEMPREIAAQSRIRGGYAEGWAKRFGAGPKYPPNLSLYSPEMIGAWKDAAPGMARRLQGAGEAMKGFDFSTMTTMPYPAGAGADNSRTLSQTINGSSITINGATDPQATAAIIQRHEARRGQDAMRYAASIMA